MKIGAITLTLAFSMMFAFLVFAGMPPASDAQPCPSTLEIVNGQADDGIGDCVDNCAAEFNPAQIDSNFDGFGNLCDADFDQSGLVDLADLGAIKKVLLSSAPGPPYDPDIDLDSSCVIALLDFGRLKKLLLLQPGPSCGTIPGVPCPPGIGFPSPCP